MDKKSHLELKVNQMGVGEKGPWGILLARALSEFISGSAPPAPSYHGAFALEAIDVGDARRFLFYKKNRGRTTKKKTEKN